MKNRNWPVIIAALLCVTFIVGVWVNSYRVTHAGAQVTSAK